MWTHSVDNLGSTNFDILNHKCVKKVLDSPCSFVFPLGGAMLAKAVHPIKAQKLTSVTGLELS